MTYQPDCTLPEVILEQLAEQGLDAVPELIRIVIDAAMQLERQKYLRAGPYERSARRRGQANGYKPKTVATRMGKIIILPLESEPPTWPGSQADR